MNTTLVDLQDRRSSLNQLSVRSRADLFAAIDAQQERTPFGCELVAEDGSKLTIGVGSELGFVQHTPSDGNPPYLVAVNQGESGANGHVSFLIGNTPTPIARRFCFPMTEIKRLAAHFVETGSRSDDVFWEEV